MHFASALLLGAACLINQVLSQQQLQQQPSKAPPSKSTIRILNPNHTGFTVSSITESLKFFTGVLGLPVTRRFNSVEDPIATLVGVAGANISFAFLALPGSGGAQLELQEFTGSRQPRRMLSNRPESGDVGSSHLSLDMVGLDEAVRLAPGVGWRLVGGPVVLPDRNRAVYLRSDREGITVELFEAINKVPRQAG